MKGFKYQIAMNISLHKEKINCNTEYSTVYFNSITKTIINRYNRIDNWINEGSGWIIDSINGQHVNITKYAPLFGSSFIELPSQLKNPKKGLINIKNKDNKCFLWCHIRHLNLIDDHSNRINKKR